MDQKYLQLPNTGEVLSPLNRELKHSNGPERHYEQSDYGKRPCYAGYVLVNLSGQA